MSNPPNMSMSMPQLTTPDSLKTKMETLQQQLPPMLDDFEKYYVFYHTNPNYPEYNQMFSNIKSNLNQLSSQMFTLNNEVESNISSLSSSMLDLNSQIQQLKSDNSAIEDNANVTQQMLQSSSLLISDYSQIYDDNYLKNWGLFLSIGLSLFIITVIFKKQQPINVRPTF